MHSCMDICGDWDASGCPHSVHLAVLHICEVERIGYRIKKLHLDLLVSCALSG